MIKAIRYNKKICIDDERGAYVYIEEFYIPTLNVGFNRGEYGNTLNVFPLMKPGYLQLSLKHSFDQEYVTELKGKHDKKSRKELKEINHILQREEKEKEEAIKNANLIDIEIDNNLVKLLLKFMELRNKLQKQVDELSKKK
jgi:hypothetical protein